MRPQFMRGVTAIKGLVLLLPVLPYAPETARAFEYPTTGSVIKDWTGNGVIDNWDVGYYYGMVYNPAWGRSGEWPKNRFTNRFSSTTRCNSCHFM